MAVVVVGFAVRGAGVVVVDAAEEAPRGSLDNPVATWARVAAAVAWKDLAAFAGAFVGRPDAAGVCRQRRRHAATTGSCVAVVGSAVADDAAAAVVAWLHLDNRRLPPRANWRRSAAVA